MTINSTHRQAIGSVANVLVLGGLWLLYAVVRGLTTDTQPAALGNAAQLLDIEAAIGIDVEQAVQSALDWPQAFVAANSYYLLHFPLTLAVLAVAFWRGRSTVFAVMRNSLVGCIAVALLIHLFVPMAPPRMLPGFVDAGNTFGPDPYALAGSENANQFAAMPSMHVAWAILCGYAIWQLSSHRLSRVIAVAHPTLTSLVVVVTGHHFVSDVAIGAAVAGAALSIVSWACRRSSGGLDQAIQVSPPCNRTCSTRATAKLPTWPSEFTTMSLTRASRSPEHSWRPVRHLKWRCCNTSSALKSRRSWPHHWCVTSGNPTRCSRSTGRSSTGSTARMPGRCVTTWPRVPSARSPVIPVEPSPQSGRSRALMSHDVPREAAVEPYNRSSTDCTGGGRIRTRCRRCSVLRAPPTPTRRRHSSHARTHPHESVIAAAFDDPRR